VGEKQNQTFQLSFNASLKVDFRESRVTSDFPTLNAFRNLCGSPNVPRHEGRFAGEVEVEELR
jgi:hypothetical protein